MLLALLLSVVTAANAASYKVNISAMTNGSIMTEQTTVAEGTTVTLSVTPADGYYIEAKDIIVTPTGDVAQTRTDPPIIAVAVQAVKGQITPEGQGNFTFVMPKSNVTITATFHERTDISAAWTAATPTGTVNLKLTTLSGYDSGTVIYYNATEQKAGLADAGVVYNTTTLFIFKEGGTYTGHESTNGLWEYDAMPVYSSADYTNAGTKYVDFTLRGQYKGKARGTYRITRLPISVEAKSQEIPYGGVITSTVDHAVIASGSLISGHTMTGISIECIAVEGTTTGTGGKKYPSSDTYGKVLQVTPNSVVIQDADGKDVSANYDVTVTTATAEAPTNSLAGDLTIVGYDITGAAVVVDENEYTYDGEQHGATVRVTQDAASGGGFIGPDQYDVYYTGTGTTSYAKSTTQPKDAGTYAVSVEAKTAADVTGSQSNVGTLTIKPMPILAKAYDASKFYTDDLPALTATVNGYLEADQYTAVTGLGTLTTTATRESPVGIYDISFSALPTVSSNYTLVNNNGTPIQVNTKVGTLTVLQLPLQYATASLSGNVKEYTGQAQTPTVVITGNGITIPSAGNYTLVYRREGADTELTEAVQAGTYTVIVRATENGSVSGEKEIGTLTINPKVVTSASTEITIEAGYPTYDGTPKDPTSLTVKDGTLTVAATDYTATYSNNVNAGNEARVTLTMMGNYEGTVVRNYTILPKAVTVKAKDQTILVGEVIRTGEGTATVTGLVSGHTLKSASVSTSYTAAGNYPTGITVSGAWIVAGETDMTANYNITYQTGALTIAAPNTNPNITVEAIADQAYDGTAKTPAVTVNNSGTSLAGSDYEVSYENNVEAGTNTARALIVLKGDYSGYMVQNFTITPKPLTVTANAQTITYGQAVSSTTDKVSVDGLITTHVLSSVTLTPASTNAGTDIALTPSLAAVSDGSGNDVTRNYAITYTDGTITINRKKYSEHPADFTVDNVSNVVYNGQSQKLVPVVKDVSTVLEEGLDYTLSYTANTTDVGTKTITITLGGSRGNYEGTFTKTYDVTQRTAYVMAIDQTAVYSNPLSILNSMNFIELSGQVSGHVLSSATVAYDTDIDNQLNTVQHGDFVGAIQVSNIKIVDGKNNVVTTNYNLEIQAGTLTVLEKNATATMSLTGGGTYDYTGAPIEPAVTVTGGGTYTLLYQGNIEVGKGLVIAQFSDNTALSAGFEIIPRPTTVTASAQEIAFGNSISSDISQATATNLIPGHRLGSIMLTTDKTAPGTYASAITASNACIVDANGVDATANYSISYGADGDLTILGKPYSETTFTIDLDGGNSFPYKAAAYEPAVIVKDNGKTLAVGTDYDVAYSNNEDASTETAKATVTVTFKGNYSGSATANFTITKRRVTVTPKEQAITYNTGGPKTTAADLSTLVAIDGLLDGHALSGVTLTSDKRNVGIYPSGIYATAAAVMSGTTDVSDNYEVVTGYGKLTIVQKAYPNGGDITFTAIADQTYTGTVITPDVVAKDKGVNMVLGTDYAVTGYVANTNVGTATANVSFMGNYSGTATTTFRIVQKDVTVTAVDQSIVFGEEISTAVNWATLTDQAAGHTLGSVAIATDATQAGVHEGAITVNNAKILAGTTDVTTNYNISYVSGKLTVLQKASENLTTETIPDFPYTGKAIEPSVIVMDGTKVLESGMDYDVSYENNINAGPANAVITLKGNYSGAITQHFNITKLALTVTAKDQTVTFGDAPGDGTGDVTVTGLAGEQILTAITLTPSITEVGEGMLTPSVAAVSDAEGNDVTVNYDITYNTGKLTIVQKATDNLTATLTPTSFIYNGQACTPAVTVKDRDKLLVLGSDYDVKYENNTDAGTAEAVITMKGNYDGSIVCRFDIAPVAVTVKAKEQEVVFGEPIIVGVSWAELSGQVAGHLLADVTLTAYKTEAGTYDDGITASGAVIKFGDKDVTSNYVIAYESGKLVILAKADNGLTVDAISDTPYTGKAIEPAVTVRDGKKVLKAKIDYDVSYRNNTNAGLAQAVISMKGNYSGSLSQTFNITKLALTVTAKPQTVDYGAAVSSQPGDVTVEGLLPEHQLTAVILTPSTTMPTTDGTLTPSAAVITDGQGTNVTANYDITYTGSLLTIISKDVEDGDVTVIIEEDEDGKPTGRVTEVEDKPVVNIPETVIGPDGEEIPVTKIDADAFEGKEDIHDIYIPQHFELEIEDPTFNGWCTPEKGARVHVYQTLLKTYADGQLKDLVADGLLVTDIVSQNDMFTFSNAFNTILPEGVRQHICRVVDNQVHKYEVKSDVINRETGVLLTAKPGTHVFVATTRTTPASLYAGNELRPVMESEHISEVSLAYLLTMNEFHKMNLNNSIPDGKAYLQWPDPATYQAAPARLQLAGDETGIGSVNSARESECWFDLMGNRIGKPTRKGVYILNGRKTVVK
jgi:hypothetical protein